MKRFITQVTTEGIHTEIGPELLRGWAANFPANAARRMTRLGLLLGHAMREFTVGPEDAVVYATTFAEALTTERYLGSFPGASPLFFQTSIHPSAIEQVLINRAFPVRELTPLAGRAGLGPQAALTALLTPAECVFLTGGEELGTWLAEAGACSEVAFAFALRLERENVDGTALGALSWSEAETPGAEDGNDEDLGAFFELLRGRRSRRWRRPGGGGTVELVWF